MAPQAFDFELHRGGVVTPRSIDKLPADLCAVYKYLQAKAVYKPRLDKRTGIMLETGQLTTTITFLVEHFRPMGWSRDVIRRILHAISKPRLIHMEAITKPHRGYLITILNYNDICAMRVYGATTNPRQIHDKSTTNPHNNKEVKKETSKQEKTTLFGDDETITSESNRASTRKKPQKRSKMKQSNPDIKAFIDYAFQSFQKRFTGRKLLINGGKDGASVERLLKTYSLGELMAYWTDYLADDDDFVAVKSIASFSAAAVIMRYVTGENAGEPETEVCPICSGDREIRQPGKDPIQCPRCKGNGRVQK